MGSKSYTKNTKTKISSIYVLRFTQRVKFVWQKSDGNSKKTLKFGFSIFILLFALSQLFKRENFGKLSKPNIKKMILLTFT